MSTLTQRMSDVAQRVHAAVTALLRTAFSADAQRSHDFRNPTPVHHMPIYEHSSGAYQTVMAVTG
jgi:hypothetical protein